MYQEKKKKTNTKNTTTLSQGDGIHDYPKRNNTYFSFLIRYVF